MASKCPSIPLLYHSILFLLQWTWICHHNYSLAFSTPFLGNNFPKISADQCTNPLQRPYKVGDVTCLTSSLCFQHSIYNDKYCFSLHGRNKRSSLNLSSPSHQQKRYVSRMNSREKIRRFRVFLKKYMITKPLTLLRKEIPGRLIPIQTEHHVPQESEMESLQLVNSNSSLEGRMLLSPRIVQLPKNVIFGQNVASQSIEPSGKETTSMVAEYPIMEENTAESHVKWALSARDVDITGLWRIIVSEDFKKKYDTYLARLGQPALVRSIATGIVEYTTENIYQNGCEVTISGKNLRGDWNRTLLSSGWDYSREQYISDVSNPIKTADSETVQAESWWEDNGKVHVSWMNGVKKYGGGAFESRRYLENNGEVLVCESTFHQSNQEQKLDKATITWKFKRTD